VIRQGGGETENREPTLKRRVYTIHRVGERKRRFRRTFPVTREDKKDEGKIRKKMKGGSIQQKKNGAEPM